MKNQKWSLPLDELCEEIFHYDFRHESPAGHYVVFSGSKNEAITQMLRNMRGLLEEIVYESDDYGYPHEK